MPVNLNKLNISLDQFNAVSSGKYNIGQLKLGEDGASVYRTNRHKTLTFLNDVSISPEESFALKSAFCKALAREGLSRYDIEAVKKKLGIDDGTINEMRVGRATPLSAADVRQIIDEYAGKINIMRAAKERGADALQTSKEIYRGVSKSTLESRAATRASVNARTVGQVMSAADYSVNKLLDMLQYTGKEESVTMDAIQKGIAQEILQRGSALFRNKSVVLTTSNDIRLSPGPDKTVFATFSLDNGNTFSVDTGLTITALRHQMSVVTGDKRADEVTEGFDKDDKAELLKELEKAFEEAGDAEVVNRKKNNALRSLDTNIKPKRPLRNDERTALALAEVRESFTKILEPLQMALKQARPFDKENVEQANEVRDVLEGNKKKSTRRTSSSGSKTPLTRKSSIPARRSPRKSRAACRTSSPIAPRTINI